jgi:uracil-DNA glycosylase family 4
VSFLKLNKEVIACESCPRLREWCTTVAREKRKSFVEWDYWGKPVPGFGDTNARIWIIGLAPAAHGANRTGRIFTGDRSGDFLFAALHRVGLANQPTSTHREDGLTLADCYISATARCAPPANKPTADEVENCSAYLDREWKLLRKKRVLLALGKIAWDAAIDLARRNECGEAARSKDFGHGAIAKLSDRLSLVGSYHVSQQNTFTGKLTTTMFDKVLRECQRLST